MRHQQLQLQANTHHPCEAHSSSSEHTQQQLPPASRVLPNNPSISSEGEWGWGMERGAQRSGGIEAQLIEVG